MTIRRRAGLTSLGAVVAGLAAAVIGVVPAAAQTPYPPEVLSTTVVACGEGEIVVGVDGAHPGSNIHITFDYEFIPDAEYDVAADEFGFFSGPFPLPSSSDTGQVFTVIVEGFDFVIGDPDGEPFESVLIVNREECPDLPETGADSWPIGRAALGVSLVGLFLAVVAMRRRDHGGDADRDGELVGT